MAWFPGISNILLLTLLVFALESLNPVPALAAMKKEDEARLKALLERTIEYYENSFSNQSATFIKKGDIIIEPGDSYFAATLPHLSLQIADGSKFEIGMVAINAIPTDKPEEWKMTVALPTPLIFYDVTGTPALTIDIGAQSMAGIYHEKLRNYVRMNALYKDVRINDTQNQVRVLIPEISAVYDLKEGKDKLLSGPMNMALKNTQVNFEKTGGAVKIGLIGMDMSLKDYSIESMAALQEKVEALTESLSAGDPAAVSKTSAMGFYNLFLDYLTTLWDGFGMKMTVSGVDMTRPPIAGSQPGTLKLEQATYGLEVTGFRKGSVTIRNTLGMKGLNIVPKPEEFDVLSPMHLSIDYKVDNIPVAQLAAQGKTTLQSAIGADPMAAQAAGLQALMMVPKILTDAGTGMVIQDTSIGNDDYNLTLKGTGKANAAAQKGFTGKARMEIEGLDGLVSSLTAQLQKPDLSDSKRQHLQQILQTLTVLQMTGQQVTEKDAKDKKAPSKAVRGYDFELTADGRQLLNGADMSALLGIGAPQPANPAPPTEGTPAPR